MITLAAVGFLLTTAALSRNAKIVFLGIIGFSFPQGQSLRALMLQPRLAARATHASGLDLDLPGRSPAVQQSFIALLSSTRRTVKNKQYGAVAWVPAQSGLRLKDRHSVQTYSRSGAEISFGDENRVSLGENSLIVIRRLEQNPTTSARRASLLLLDVELPGPSGFELLQDLNRHPRHGRIPVIMLTAHGQPHHEVRGLELGAQDFVAKPFNAMVLRARVRRAMKRNPMG